MDLKQILESLKNLSSDDKAKLQEFLAANTDSNEPESQPEQETDITKADEQVEEKAVNVVADIEADKVDGFPDEDVAADEHQLTEAVLEDEQSDKEAIAEPAKTDDLSPDYEDEPVPKMSKDEPMQSEAEIIPAETEQEIIIDEQGGEMPIDYQQIIDGLNAKNMALEAENRTLKAKVDGAFGLSGKPGGFVPVNNLYDRDTSDIPKMRK